MYLCICLIQLAYSLKAALKYTKLQLELLTNIDMALMVENIMLFIEMQKLIKNILKVMKN